MTGTEREPWMCAECFEVGKFPPGFANYGDDGEICGFHYGVQKGYINAATERQD